MANAPTPTQAAQTSIKFFQPISVTAVANSAVDAADAIYATKSKYPVTPDTTPISRKPVQYTVPINAAPICEDRMAREINVALTYA